MLAHDLFQKCFCLDKFKEGYTKKKGKKEKNRKSESEEPAPPPKEDPVPVTYSRSILATWIRILEEQNIDQNQQKIILEFSERRPFFC